MGEIKPIETIYKGYRFRSRLEARWAVFFDQCYIKYEYETEGFELPSGERYLPDFYLPEYKWHVEVKPLEKEGAEEEIKKAIRFIDGSNIKALLVLSEIPKPHNHLDLWMYPVLYKHPVCDEVVIRWVMLHPEYISAVEDYFGAFFVTEWSMCKDVFLYSIKDDLKEKLKPYPDYKAKYQQNWDGVTYTEYSEDGDPIDYEQMKKELTRIYNKARQARFEHGECG